MNFEIKKEFFLDYLSQIQKILPQKTFFPIYCYIKLTTQKDILFLEVYNSNLAVRIKIFHESLKIKKEGSLIVSGKYFIDIIKKIDCSVVKIFFSGSRFLVIETDFSEYKLKTIDNDDFPQIDFSFDFINFLEIESNLFKKIIKETNVVTSKDKQNIILTGVNLIYKKPFLIALATDSFRLSQKKIKIDSNYFDFNIVIPNKSLEELIKLLELQKNGIAKIFIDKQKFFLQTESLSFQAPLLEGNYPHLPKIKEEEYVNFIKIDRNILIKILERVSLFLPKEKDLLNNLIEFKISLFNTIEISSYSEEIGNALEKITFSEGSVKESINTFFNVKYLEEILKVFSIKEIKFSFDISTKPFVISSEEEKTLLYLILPFSKQ